MIISAIWDKSARLNFSKVNRIRASENCNLLKCDNHAITSNNIYAKMSSFFVKNSFQTFTTSSRIIKRLYSFSIRYQSTAVTIT